MGNRLSGSFGATSNAFGNLSDANNTLNISYQKCKARCAAAGAEAAFVQPGARRKVLACSWRGGGELPHAQGQRRSAAARAELWLPSLLLLFGFPLLGGDALHGAFI